MAEQADALDLKSNVAKATYRFDPGHRHHIYRGVEQLVARRAHNPEAVWFKSHLRNQKILTHMSEDLFIILCFSLLLAPIFLRAESAMILRTFSSLSFNKIGEVGNQLTRKINMGIY